MQIRRRFSVAALAAVAVSTLVLAGCSSSDKPSTEGLPDGATLLKQSAETTKALKSAHLELKVDGTVKGLPVKTLTGDLRNSPNVAALGHTRVTLAGEAVEVDFVVLDGKLYGSLDPGVWNDFGDAATIYDVSLILNPESGLANVLANFTEPKVQGRETINGVQAVKVTGKVSAAAVNKLAPKIGVTDTVPATAWIREDGSHDLVQAKLDISSGNSIQMTLSKWNDPVTVNKPPGV